MAAFGSQVMSSAQETDPGETQRFQDLIAKRAAAAAKQFGQVGGGVPAPAASLGDTLKAERAGVAGEFDRRKSAATGAYGYAQQAGQQEGGISDRVRAALLGRQQATGQMATSQNQQLLTAGQAARGATQQFNQQNSQLDYQRYKTDAARSDALSFAQQQGNLDVTLLNDAKDNALSLADIDRAFKLKFADIDNLFKDWQSQYAADNAAYINKITNNAKSTGTLISGITEMAGTIGKEYGGDIKKWADTPSTPAPTK